MVDANVHATASSARSHAERSRWHTTCELPDEEVARMHWSDVRKDAPFFGVMFAIAVTALALTVATVSLLARM